MTLWIEGLLEENWSEVVRRWGAGGKGEIQQCLCSYDYFLGRGD